MSTKFKTGDIVTWGSGLVGYEYVGEISGGHVLQRPHGLGWDRYDKGYDTCLNAYVYWGYDLRKVTRKVKVNVELIKSDDKYVAYAISEDESKYPRSHLAHRHNPIQIIEFEVPS